MNGTEILIAILIHLIVPLIGLSVFLFLSRKIRMENIEKPPTAELFLVFSTYGGLLLVVLTSLFGAWSGMASLGTFYLILLAPFVMGLIAYRNYKLRSVSKYHIWTFISGIMYFVVTPLIFLAFVLAES